MVVEHEAGKQLEAEVEVREEGKAGGECWTLLLDYLLKCLERCGTSGQRLLSPSLVEVGPGPVLGADLGSPGNQPGPRSQTLTWSHQLPELTFPWANEGQMYEE